MTVVLVLIAAMLLQQAPDALNPQWGTVLPDHQALTFAQPRLCNRPAPGRADGTWVPDAGTIRVLESKLTAELQAAIDLSREPGRPLLATDFYRQYAPLVIGGKRIVYVNGLHRIALERSARSNWRTVASHPCDGGMLFFGTEYDVANGQLSKIIFNGGGRGPTPAALAGARPPELDALLVKASVSVPLYSWCRAGDGFAVTPLDKQRRYLFLHGDGRTETLAVYEGRPELSCYSRREAERLNASIRESATIEGTITPRWDSTVLCGFVGDTVAVCWQFAPDERRFVTVGGWTT